MKQIILAAMAVMTLTGSASATSNWDMFWGTVVPEALDPAHSGWDEFFGTTLNPQNTGWDDFWYSCVDPDKTIEQCVGTIAVGVGAVIAAPLAIVVAAAGATAAVSSVVAAPVVLPTVLGIPIQILTTGPIMAIT